MDDINERTPPTTIFLQGGIGNTFEQQNDFKLNTTLNHRSVYPSVGSEGDIQPCLKIVTPSPPSSLSSADCSVDQSHIQRHSQRYQEQDHLGGDGHVIGSVTLESTPPTHLYHHPDPSSQQEGRTQTCINANGNPPVLSQYIDSLATQLEVEPRGGRAVMSYSIDQGKIREDASSTITIPGDGRNDHQQYDQRSTVNVRQTIGPCHADSSSSLTLSETKGQRRRLPFPASQPTKESVLRRLTEALMRHSLTMIDMSQRGLHSSDARLVKLALLQNSSLSNLKLGYNNLGDEGVSTLASGIAIHVAISALDLGFNNVGDIGCMALAEAILSRNRIRTDCMNSATKNSGSNKKVALFDTLYLAGNCIGEEGATSLASVVRNGCGLRRLHLTGNGVGPDGIRVLMEAITEDDLRQQREVANFIHARKPKSLSSLQSPKGAIHELFLGGTGMGNVGCCAVGKMLEQNSSLRVLSLDNCHMGDDEGIILTDAIKKNQKQLPLEKIKLSFNELTCKSIGPLMNAFWASSSLKELLLDNNAIGDEGIEVISNLLSAAPTLKKLDVGFNSMSIGGMSKLMKAVAENTNLSSLSISGNLVDCDSAKAVAYALAYNKSLESFFMDHCSIESEGQRHICAGIVSNSETCLHTVTGIAIGGNIVSLGLPGVLERCSNEQVLKFILFMWRRMRKEQEENSVDIEIDPLNMLQNVEGNATQRVFSGPLSPPTVIAVASRAYESLGENGEDFFRQVPGSRREVSFESPLTEDAIMVETSVDGRQTINSTNLSDTLITDKNDYTKENTLNAPDPLVPNYTACAKSTPSPPKLDLVVRKKHIVEWLCINIHHLNELSHLPFNPLELLRLHQHFFNAIAYDCGESTSSLGSTDEMNCTVLNTFPGCSNISESYNNIPVVPRHQERVLSSDPVLNTNIETIPVLKRKVSYHALNDACMINSSLQKLRKPDSTKHMSVSKLIEDRIKPSMQPRSKRARRNRSRISFLPRISSKLDTYLESCHQKSLILLRQLQYVEKSLLNSSVYPVDSTGNIAQLDGTLASDAEMILIDMI